MCVCARMCVSYHPCASSHQTQCCFGGFSSPTAILSSDGVTFVANHIEARPCRCCQALATLVYFILDDFIDQQGPAALSNAN